MYLRKIRLACQSGRWKGSGAGGSSNCTWSAYTTYKPAQSTRLRQCNVDQYMAGEEVEYKDNGMHFRIKCCQF